MGKNNKRRVGPYVEDTRNDNKHRLIEICEQKVLKMMNEILKNEWTTQYKQMHIDTTYENSEIIDYKIVSRETKGSHLR